MRHKLVIWEPLSGDDPKWDGRYMAVDDYGTIYGLGDDYLATLDDAREHLEFPDEVDDLAVYRCSDTLAHEIQTYGGNLDWVIREEDGVAI